MTSLATLAAACGFSLGKSGEKLLSTEYLWQPLRAAVSIPKADPSDGLGPTPRPIKDEDCRSLLSRASELPLSFLLRQIGERHDRIAA
jgi:hypothetical protein